MRFIIIEVGIRYIKLYKGEKSFLRKAACEATFHEYNSRVTSSDINDLLCATPLSQYQKIILLFSRAYFMTRPVSLPSGALKDIEKMLVLKARNGFLGVQGDPLFCFFYSKRNRNRSEVLLFYETDQKVRSILSGIDALKGADVEALITTEGIMKGYLSQRQESACAEGVPIMLADIDTNCVEVGVFIGDELIFSRLFFYLQDENITSGINLTLSIFSKTFGGARPARILLSGLHKDIGIKAIDGVEIEFRENRGSICLKTEECSSTAVEGVIRSGFKSECELMGADERGKRFKNTCVDRCDKILRGLLCLGVMAMAVAFVFKLSVEKELMRTEKRMSLLSISDSLGTISLDSDIAVLKGYVDKRGSVCRFLSVICAELSDRVKLIYLKIESGNKCRLEGCAKDLDDVFVFVNKLRLRGLFKEVLIEHAKERQGGEVLFSMRTVWGEEWIW